jgi:cysteinyl-tRNA synthetase
MADARQRARGVKNFAEADRIRTEIEAAGWDVRDIWNGYRLVRKR